VLDLVNRESEQDKFDEIKQEANFRKCDY